MSRIDDLIRDLCPDGVEYKPLGEVGEFIRGNGIKKSDFTKQGYPCIHYGQIHTHYGISTAETISHIAPEQAIRLRKAQPGDLVIATTSEDDDAVGKATAWLGTTPVAVGGDSYIFRHSMEPKYLSYFFSSTTFSRQKQTHITGSKVRRITASSLSKIIIPAPPIEIQHEITRTLDQFIQLKAELEAEMGVRKQQYSHYLNHFFASNTNTCMRTLRDVGPVRMCKRIMKNQTSQQGDVPFYKIRTFGGTADVYISRKLYNEYKKQYHFPQPGSILISAAGTIGRAVPYDGKDAYFQDSNIVWIENDEALVLNSYLFYFYKVANWKTDDGTIKRLYNDRLLNTVIPVPPLSEQHRIVNCLDKFDTLLNDLTLGLPAEIEARRKQYEYYRDRLLSFPEKK
ncbi:restriction endonuclease subunit S [Actinomyces sp. HMSC08A09]|uniref:restriction endonuclease subunit S n=1 Tax=Actinomyces sp. HMSC08A09 TaxID=1581133 RepID=UPI000B0A3E8C|nr:restriction endonuclease subunit S [Actinomyces sp. HMSC08A09]